MSETMVERVAKAIQNADIDKYASTYPQIPRSVIEEKAGLLRCDYEAMARAAIEAVKLSAPELARENSPNLDMFAMWSDGPVSHSPQEIWNMTFDAALQEKTDA